MKKIPPLFVLLLLLLLLLSQASSGTAAEPINFSRDILPIFSDNCFHCHGPDAKAREAELRLDQPDSALRKDEPIIVPGKSGDSELLKRLLSSDPDEQMPPPKLKRKLTPQQIESVKRWIDEGAVWGKHWAFEKPQRPAVPAIRNPQSAIKNPIDQFVLAPLTKHGLRPSPEAKKETLIRRVTLDLTGLPPTPEEVDIFLNDKSPDAYEKVVDRLFKSPRYGERMVWEWLDAARYADTNGYQGDPTRTMYFWRDWVINALNQNMPFDQFSIEQLAGDQLPNPTQEQLIATGFHRNHMINGEGGRIAEESRVDYVQDRVETTGTVWMGLTLNCCRCHDHKFDPLSQKEYYQLSAYFNSIEETGGNDAGGLANPVLSFATPEQQQKIAEFKKVEAAANQERDELEKNLAAAQVAWEKTLASSDGKPAAPTWLPLVPVELKAEHGTELVKLDDGSILARGTNPPTNQYTVTVKSQLGALTGIKLEVLPHESFVNRGPGRADNGNFVLTQFEMLADGKPVSLTAISADFSQGGFSLAAALDGSKKGWAILPQFGKPLQAIMEIRDFPAAKSDIPLTFILNFQFGREHTLGHFKLYASTTPIAQLKTTPDDLRTLAAKPVEQRSEAEKKKLADQFRDSHPPFVASKKRADDAKKAREASEKSSLRTMVMRERPQPRDTFILVRGIYNKFADKVTHGVPSVLPPLGTEAPNTRLVLARWLMSPDHPLTARVTVNRHWQTFFGNGLVKTTEDFGVQGEKPSHPELLDWLACEFQQPTVSQPTVANASPHNVWNVKHLQRLIVTSATYRQASGIADWGLRNAESKNPTSNNPQSAIRNPQSEDSENRWLARGPRYRLPSWMLRDQALAASGLLVEKLGGPAVKGYQPPGIWEEATFGKISYQQDKGEALYRRSLYLFWRRIVGPTIFFDVANRQTCQVKVARTNTPLHALVMLNDVTFVEASRALAERLLANPSATSAQRIEQLYRLVLARRPNEAESKVLLAATIRLREQFSRDPAAAKKLVQIGESKRNEALDTIEHAVLTSLASAVMNLDEALTKE